MRFLKSGGLWLALGLACAAQAAPQVQVVGLFPGAAVLRVDGVRKLVREGQRGPGGVQVVRVDRSGAVLRIEGPPATDRYVREFGVDAGGGYNVTALSRDKYTIWLKAMVIMMKYTPLVRRLIAPVIRANRPLTPTARPRCSQPLV